MPRRSSSSSASPSSSASTARRCSPCEPKRAQVAVAPRARRGRRGAGRAPVVPRSRSRSSRALELLDARRLALVAQLGSRQAELAGPLGEARLQRGDRLVPAGDELGAERAHLLVPGRERLARGDALRDPPQRGVPLPDRGAVLGREAGPARREPAEHAVEVRPARRGAALDDHQPVGREDERRHLAAQLLGRAQPRAVQRRPLAARRARASPRARAATPPRDAAQRDPRRVAPEADQLRVGARPRREALRADVQRLEQVRLAGAVRPDHEHEPRLAARGRAARTSGSRVSETAADDQPRAGGSA